MLHEHPAYVTNWDTDAIQKTLDTDGVQTTTAHMCSFGTASDDEHGDGYVLKPTSCLSNTKIVLDELTQQCG